MFAILTVSQPAVKPEPVRSLKKMEAGVGLRARIDGHLRLVITSDYEKRTPNAEAAPAISA